MHNLFDKIISLENLFLAWDAFYKGKKGKEDVELFRMHLEDNIFSLHSQLLSGTWRHGGYENFLISDPKTRQISKASVGDRVAQHAVFRILEPVFDKTFIFDSWSCRVGKGTHKSVLRLHQKLEQLSKTNLDVWILKCDIRKFFENVNQNILFEQIQRKIKDEKTLCLLRSIIFSVPSGLPLGNLTSQLFANIYFNCFDHFVKERLKADIYLRYSDDFVLVSTSKQELENSLLLIRNFLNKKLNLALHPDKISFRKYHWGIDWLGFVLYPNYRVMRRKTYSRMQNKIKSRVNDFLGNKIDYSELRSTLASYDGILQHCSHSETRKHLFCLSKCL